MDIPQSLISYVSIYLGAGDTAVAQKFLDGSDINALI